MKFVTQTMTVVRDVHLHSSWSANISRIKTFFFFFFGINVNQLTCRCSKYGDILEVRDRRGTPQVTHLQTIQYTTNVVFTFILFVIINTGYESVFCRIFWYACRSRSTSSTALITQLLSDSVSILIVFKKFVVWKRSRSMNSFELFLVFLNHLFFSLQLFGGPV